MFPVAKKFYVNIVERDWKNNNLTEAFFDLLELPFKLLKNRDSYIV
jgi:hypothetical protein